MRYGIWKVNHFYRGTINSPRDGWVKDGADRPLFFESADEAIDKAHEMSGTGTYYLDHGEYARPEYRVRRLEES